MFGTEDGGGGGGGGFEDAEAAARARARYQHYVRIGMLLCLILLLMDSPPNHPPSSSSSSSHTNLNTLAVNPMDAKLLSQILPLRGTHSVPKNITGLFRGYWTMNRQVNGTTKEMKGNMLLQVKSLAIENIPSLHFLYGFMKLYNVPKLSSPRTFEDILYPMQGIYVLSTGESTIITTPSPHHRVFLVIPLASQNKTASARRLSPDVDFAANDYLYLPLNDLVLDGVSSLSENLDSMISSQRILNLFSMFETIETRTPEIPQSRRHLDSLLEEPEGGLNNSNHPSVNGSGTISVTIKQNAKSRIIPGDIFKRVADNDAEMERYRVGSSGLELLLVVSPSKPVKNSSPVDLHLGGFGYDSLPPNFKMFQQSHGASRGYQQSSRCNFAVKTQSSDVELSTHHEKPKSLNMSHEDAYIFDEMDSTLILRDHHPAIRSFQSQIRGKSVLNGPEHCKDEYLHFDMTGVYYKINFDVVENKIFHYSVLYFLVCAAQIYLLLRQMNHSSTPAGAGKVSVLCISAQAVLDAGICIVHLLSSSSVNGLVFYILLTIAFMKLIIFCILEMRLVIGIYQARYAQDMAIAGWQGLRNHLATLHARFYAALFGVILLVDFFFNNPVVIIFALYSFWIPQIIYSAYSGGRKPLDPVYVIGMSLSRLIFPLYVFACPNNVYHVLTERTTLSASASISLLFWLTLQVVVLLLQDRWGPRFFVPSQFLPVKYNYFRPVPRRTNSNPNSAGDIETGTTECVICYTAVDENDRNYMITPCDHLFHQDCLSRWLEVKLECPVCRAPLPPADD